MEKLNVTAYQTLLPMLDGVPFNTLFVRSVLEDHVPGEVYVDDAACPMAAYIVHGYGMSLLLGDVQHAMHFTHPAWLQAWPRGWDVSLRALVSAGKAEEYGRVNFAFDEGGFLRQNPAPSLWENDIIRTPVDMLRTIEGSVVPNKFWHDHLLDRCIAYTVLVDGQPASTAYASYIHGTDLEIGIETAAAYQGRGMAKAAAAALIRDCLRRGFTPHWSCRYENMASYQLAQRLGFVETLRMPYYHIIP